MSYLEPLKDYLKNNCEVGLLDCGWSESDIYLAKQELKKEKSRKIAMFVVCSIVVFGVVGGVFAVSETGGEIFKFLSGKVVSVHQHSEKINDTDIKYSFWIGANYDNAECYVPQDCITLKGEGWGCIDNFCVELKNYGG